MVKKTRRKRAHQRQKARNQPFIYFFLKVHSIKERCTIKLIKLLSRKKAKAGTFSVRVSPVLSSFLLRVRCCPFSSDLKDFFSLKRRCTSLPCTEHTRTGENVTSLRWIPVTYEIVILIVACSFRSEFTFYFLLPY